MERVRKVGRYLGTLHCAGRGVSFRVCVCPGVVCFLSSGNMESDEFGVLTLALSHS